ncbi:MAG TPA: maleylpyruvate isomerase N-terminal domain-containing protein [Frankiaceae bacterium]|nr:maleylpyruvate isomerase N-terminal domain-containing protein [Frankiaceae bacterium]
MAERTPLSQYYRESRVRLSAFVSEHAEADDTPVPATPGWTVHDVIAHLVGVAEDLVSGKLTDGPTFEWTAGHVARGGGIPTAELLQKWAGLSPDTERIADGGAGPLVGGLPLAARPPQPGAAGADGLVRRPRAVPRRAVHLRPREGGRRRVGRLAGRANRAPAVGFALSSGSR